MERLYKVLVISGALLTICFCLRAQYLPFVEEGKVWTYYFDLSGMEEEYGMSGFFVYQYLQGDTIIEGSLCKKMYEYSEWEKKVLYMGALYEDEGVVFLFPSQWPGQKTILFDFSLQVGDVLWNPYIEYEVKGIWTIDLFGTQRRVYSIGIQDDDLEDTYWIEGIGSIQGPDAPVFMRGGGEFMSCEVNGNTQYTWDAFFEDLSTKISKIIRDKNADGLYDLQGRRLTREPSRGMYIKNGKKYLKR